MAGIYDVHTHLNDELYEENNLQSAEIIAQSKKMGIDMMNIVGIDLKTSKIAIRQATQSRNIYALIGIHPNEIGQASLHDLDELMEMANSKNVIGIGEIGLDYSRSSKNRLEQLEFFEKQLDIAQELKLPVMIHIRDKQGSVHAYKDAYKVLSKVKLDKVIIHGFEGKEDYAKKFLDLGFFLSFNGKITYGSKSLEKVVKNASLNKILIESDAPYFSPIPYQKEINFPGNTNLVAEKIAQIKKVDVDEVISASRLNGQKFFDLND